MKKNNSVFIAFFAMTLLALASVPAWTQPAVVAGAAGNPYPNMPLIAPIGVRTGKHIPINESAQELGKGLYMITDNAIQSMFLVYEKVLSLLTRLKYW